MPPLPLLAQVKTHLLIEKPICASLAEAERVLTAARQNGCLVQVGHIEHFNPVMSFLEKQIDEPRYITAERLARPTSRAAPRSAWCLT